MRYAVSILRTAQKELALLPVRDFELIKETIRSLALDPRPPACQKLSVREGWRLRVGKYRIIYEIDDREQTVVILNIGHRRDVYR
ncbi:MAG: type II toxin-antitoxin system RelE/ParE family toxin [Deltaproteobacteria bacterium]|nr:type II toxin-antitoxin system RelE/ParE family toxin [Deltaproteobacteria bacterium]MBM4289848.1 type II toxin-antitoxin system RelE/ParE family toxin [Deltaproteobacteria bacterium]